MFTTRQLTVAAASFTLALALPFAGGTALAGGEVGLKVVAETAAPETAAQTVEVAADPAENDANDQAHADDAAPKDTPSRAHLLKEPKALSNEVKKGLEWLIKQQHDNGGWGQGEESANMRGGQNFDPSKDLSNVGDTCAATLTLIRSGSTPSSGPYDVNIRKAVDYVCESIEAADADSLSVTSIKGTRLQSKLGTYIDTFLAAQMLGEVKNKMASKEANERVDACLDKVIAKIEKNQKQNGQFEGNGWALVLNDALANKALNTAAQAGADVQFAKLEASRANAQDLAPAEAGGLFGDGGGRAAGVELYGAASSVGGQRETDTTYRQKIEQDRDEVRTALEKAGEKLADADDDAGKEIKQQVEFALKNLDKAGKDIEESEALAQATLRIAELSKTRDSTVVLFSDGDLKNIEGYATYNNRWADNNRNLRVAQTSVVKRLKDEQFVKGFGNNGGEEFLSYARIGESLYLEGGKDWESFDKNMTENLTRVQNEDGSWSGHHCITGRTFCTSAALSVLMTDRMAIPKELIEAAKAEQAGEAGHADDDGASPEAADAP